MSYILDALRRADSERARGAVPGVHAQPVPAAAGAPDRAPRSVPLAWVAIGGLLVLVGVLAWQLLSATEPQRVAAVAAPVAPVMEPAPPPAPIAVPEMPAPEAAPPPAPKEAPRAERKPPKRAAPRPQPVPAASPQPAPEPPIVKQAELPPQIRSQLPALSVGGSVYSKDPASRYLILNGQLFRENAEVAQDLTLEQIHLRSAVLRFKDYRYSIEY